MSRSFVTRTFAALAIIAALSAGTASARPHPTPTPTASPSIPPEDPAITEIARHEFVAWQAGIVDRSRYGAAMQSRLGDNEVTQTSKALSQAGALQRTQWLGPYPAPADVPGGHAYLFHMFCANRAVYELLTIAPDGKIGGIGFRDTLGPE